MVLWRRLVAGALMLGSSLSVTSLAVASENAEQWVQKMLSAARQTSYQGHSVMLSGGQITSLAIYHAPFDNEVWERVVHLSGEPAEILRKGTTVTCLHPDSASRIDLPGTPMGKLTALEESAQAISRYYRFDRAGNERVAGREGVRIDVKPLDAHRYGYSLWLDESTGVLLKSQTNPETGDPLEVFEFVTLEIGAPLTRDSFQPADGLQSETVAPAASGPGAEAASGWEAGWLPEGFRAVGPASRVSKGGASSRVYTDGLAAFTVFYERGRGAITESNRARGATVAVNRALPDSDVVVTVVGEIPLATANRVSEHIRVPSP